MNAPTFGDKRLPPRFWSKVRPSESGCWQWTAHKVSGYGAIRWNRKMHKAHRIAYLHLIGDIPAGLVCDHICHQPDTCRRPGMVKRSCKECNRAAGRSLYARKKLENTA